MVDNQIGILGGRDRSYPRVLTLTGTANGRIPKTSYSTYLFTRTSLKN